jgi:hypothetical protein
VCGDLFDHVRPEPQVIAAAVSVLGRFCTEGGPVVLISGNHDRVSLTPGDHALGPLSRAGIVVADSQCVLHVGKQREATLALLPHGPGTPREWLPRALADFVPSPSPHGAHRRLAVLHTGLADSTTAPWLRDSSGALPVDDLAVLCQRYNIDAAFAGDWHDGRAWDFAYTDGSSRRIPIVQCGALVPTGFDNPGVEGYGGVWVYDSATNTVERFEAEGPRFLPVQGDMAREAYLQAAEKLPGRLFVRWTAAPEYLPTAIRCLAADAHLLAGGEAVPDKRAVDAQVRTAAMATRISTTLDVALEAFVGAMALPEGVGPSAVVARARAFLASAAG